MKIVITVSIGLIGCKKTKIIEIEDDLTDDDIETIAKEEMFGMINWDWKRK